MENITSVAELKNAILFLEVEQTIKLQQLKDQFHLSFESLKPVNLLRSTLNEISSSPSLVNNLLGAVTGLATGYLSRVFMVGSSVNVFRKLIGTVLQFGVTNLVARHPDEIKSIGQFLLQHLFHRKDTNAHTRDG